MTQGVSLEGHQRCAVEAPPSGTMCCNTVKLRGVPKALATAPVLKGIAGTRLTTSGTVTAQEMLQWITCSQTLRASSLRVQFND